MRIGKLCQLLLYILSLFAYHKGKVNFWIIRCYLFFSCVHCVYVYVYNHCQGIFYTRIVQWVKKVIITFETDIENKQRKNSWHDCKLNYKHYFSANGACGHNYHSLWIHSRPPPPPFACMTGNDCVDLHSTSIKREIGEFSNK